MHEITVGNLRDKSLQGIRCDRASVLGNPFHMEKELYRHLVCKAYSEYFYEMIGIADRTPFQIAKDVSQEEDIKISSAWQSPVKTAFRAELERIKSIAHQKPITLLCWCAPKRCHCDTIATYLRGL